MSEAGLGVHMDAAGMLIGRTDSAGDMEAAVDTLACFLLEPAPGGA